jgi:LysR family transcriptional regulator, nitrogen assimilation regulatory protein
MRHGFSASRNTGTRMISLRQIQYFLAVAKSGSFSAAARIAHVSQPSLCVQVNQLEQWLGTKLLSRHARGVELTAAGRAFLSHATAALEEIKRAERAVANVVKVSVGVTPTAGRMLVADLLRICKEKPRAPRLLLREGMSDELWQFVADGELDAALCYDPSEAATLRIVPLYREELFLVGGPKLLGTVEEVVDRTALGNFPLVLGYPHHRTRQLIENAMRSAGVDLRAIEEVEPRTLKRELLVRHGRCSIVPYGLFLDEIKSGELAARLIKPRLTRTGALLFNVRLPAATRQFLATAIRSIVKQRIAEKELQWRPV